MWQRSDNCISDGITNTRKNNRNRFGRSNGGFRGDRAHGKNDIDVQGGKFGCQGWQTLDSPCGVAIFDRDISSFFVTKLV
jgi:hypothetical protein